MSPQETRWVGLSQEGRSDKPPRPDGRVIEGEKNKKGRSPRHKGLALQMCVQDLLRESNEKNHFNHKGEIRQADDCSMERGRV